MWKISYRKDDVKIITWKKLCGKDYIEKIIWTIVLQQEYAADD